MSATPLRKCFDQPEYENQEFYLYTIKDHTSHQEKSRKVGHLFQWRDHGRIQSII